MNQGELIQLVRLHDRQIQILEEMIHTLQKKVDEMDDILKSPIRRAIYANKGQQSQGRLSGSHAKPSARQAHDESEG